MYGKAQRQPETHICTYIRMMSKKDAGKLIEYMYAKPMWMPVTVYILDVKANSSRYAHTIIRHLVIKISYYSLLCS